MEERGKGKKGKRKNPLVLLPTAIQVMGEIFLGINPSCWNWWEKVKALVSRLKSMWGLVFFPFRYLEMCRWRRSLVCGTPHPRNVCLFIYPILEWSFQLLGKKRISPKAGKEQSLESSKLGTKEIGTASPAPALGLRNSQELLLGRVRSGAGEVTGTGEVMDG